jgi:hypothetical protein
MQDAGRIIITNRYKNVNVFGSQSQSYFTTDGLPWRQARLRLTTRDLLFFFQLKPCTNSLYVTSSLTRRRVCRLQLLLVLASAVILRSESSGTHDHILLSQIRDSPNLEGQVPVFICPRNRVAQLYPQALGSLFVASYYSAVGIATGYGLDDQGVRVRVPVGSRIFSSLRRPDRLWDPPNLLSNGYRWFFPRG